MIHCEEVENGKINVSIRGEERDVIEEIIMILISFTRGMTDEQRKQCLFALSMATIDTYNSGDVKVSNAVESKVNMQGLKDIIEQMNDENGV